MLNLRVQMGSFGSNIPIVEALGPWKWCLMATIDSLGFNGRLNYTSNKKSTIIRVKKEIFITKFYNNKEITNYGRQCLIFLKV
jgi:hypothetical protein